MQLAADEYGGVFPKHGIQLKDYDLSREQYLGANSENGLQNLLMLHIHSGSAGTVYRDASEKLAMGSCGDKVLGKQVIGLREIWRQGPARGSNVCTVVPPP